MDIAYVSIKNKTIDNALYKQGANGPHFLRPLTDFILLESETTLTVGQNQCLTVIDENSTTNEYILRYYFNSNTEQNDRAVTLTPAENHTIHYYKEAVDVNSDIQSIPTTVSLGYLEGEDENELFYSLIDFGEPANDNVGVGFCKVNQSLFDIVFSDMDVDPNTKSMARNIKNVK